MCVPFDQLSHYHTHTRQTSGGNSASIHSKYIHYLSQIPDNGKVFKNDLLKKVADELGINIIFKPVLATIQWHFREISFIPKNMY